METVITMEPTPADVTLSAEAYFRARAAYRRVLGDEAVADFLDRLADNCAALAAEHEAIEDDYVPF